MTRKGLSLFNIQSYNLAVYANTLGYGLASSINHSRVIVTPGEHCSKNDPNIFSQKIMTLEEIEQYQELSHRVVRFNRFWM